MTFSFKGNFENVMPAGQWKTLTVAGLYSMTIQEIELRETKAGNERALFRLRVADGEHKDTPVTFGINIPTSDDDFVWRYWMTLLISLGADENKLRQNPTIEGDKLIGKTGYVNYTPAPPDDGTGSKKFAQFLWITQQQFKTQQTMTEGSSFNVAPAAVVEESGNGAGSTDPLDYLEI
jgi:hypothetical protein